MRDGEAKTLSVLSGEACSWRCG